MYKKTFRITPKQPIKCSDSAGPLKYGVYICYINYLGEVTERTCIAKFCSPNRAQEYADHCNELDAGDRSIRYEYDF